MIYLKKIFHKLQKLLHGNFFGLFQTMFRGDGLEIEDVRPYVWGDDVRNINWKLTAKYNKIYVNVFRQERDIDLHLYLDLNLNFLGGLKKRNIDILNEFLTDLFIFSRKNGINIIGFYTDLKTRNLKLVRVGKNLEKMYVFLKHVYLVLQNVDNGYVSFLDEFLKIQRKIYKRRMIFIVSDFLDIRKSQIKILKVLSEHNEVFLFKLPVGKVVGKNFSFVKVDRIGSELYPLKVYNLI